jgi:ABC-type antimicrobial peptide transport system permease subunit
MRRRIAASPHEAPSQRLEAALRARGVPTTPAEIAAERLQQRWVVSLALLVAFVGILNAMLMSVTERFREIGTMKCLGALDGFIVKLFLIESLFQGLAGTLAGIAVGLALSLGAMTLSYGSAAWKHVSPAQVAWGAALCLAIGTGLTVLAAVYPAWRAARMQPIEAMRVEM